jgi:hypothetical protein|tara:strand:+ start:295 stop:612 length:318 start_codon:yes stop_codon:yes gene_type:complete
MRVVKKGDPRNVRVQSTTTTQANQKSKKGKSKSKTTFKDSQKVTDLDTGETVSSDTVQVDKKGKIKKFKSTTEIKNKQGELLAKQIDKKRRSRTRVTSAGRKAGY